MITYTNSLREVRFIKTQTKQFDSLNDVTDYLRQKAPIGHKLTYICNGFTPWCDFYPVDEERGRSRRPQSRDQESIGADQFFTNYILDYKNKSDLHPEIFNNQYYRELSSLFSDKTFFMGFDNGEYMGIYAAYDDDLCVWFTSDKYDDNDRHKDDHNFSLERFFDNVFGHTLTDIEALLSDDVPEDHGGSESDNIDIGFYGRLKLTFDNGSSVIVGASLNTAYIHSETGGIKDTCNYWHLASCNYSKEDINYQDHDWVMSVINHCFDGNDSKYFSDIFSSFNDYQKNMFHLYMDNGRVDKEQIIKVIDHLIRFPSADSEYRENMFAYAKYIVEVVAKDVCFNADYYVEHLDSTYKLKMLLDMMTEFKGVLNEDVVVKMINEINNSIYQEMIRQEQI